MYILGSLFEPICNIGKWWSKARSNCRPPTTILFCRPKLKTIFFFHKGFSLNSKMYLNILSDQISDALFLFHTFSDVSEINVCLLLPCIAWYAYPPGCPDDPLICVTCGLNSMLSECPRFPTWRNLRIYYLLSSYESIYLSIYLFISLPLWSLGLGNFAL